MYLPCPKIALIVSFLMMMMMMTIMCIIDDNDDVGDEGPSPVTRYVCRQGICMCVRERGGQLQVRLTLQSISQALKSLASTRMLAPMPMPP